MLFERLGMSPIIGVRMVDEPVAMRRLLGVGADAIISDRAAVGATPERLVGADGFVVTSL